MTGTDEPLQDERLPDESPLASALSALINEMLRGRSDLVPRSNADRKRRLPLADVEAMVNTDFYEIGAFLEDIPFNLAKGLPLQGYQLRELNRLDPTGTEAQWGEWACLYERLSGITLEATQAHDVSRHPGSSPQGEPEHPKGSRMAFSEAGINDTPEVKERTQGFHAATSKLADCLDEARALLERIESYRHWPRGIPKRRPAYTSQDAAYSIKNWQPDLERPGPLVHGLMEEIRYCCEKLPENPPEGRTALLDDYILTPALGDMDRCREWASKLDKKLTDALAEFVSARETTTGE